MEPIQGEGGVNFYPEGFARRVRELCDARELTLIFDEVWTGCGRTGRWFGHHHLAGTDGNPVVPDIMTLGKAVGGGLPVGVMYARPEIAKLLVPGKHGSTLGGNGICTAVSRTIFDVIERDDLVGHAAVLGEHAVARLKNEKKIQAKVAGIRGRGLFLGIELKAAPEKLVDKALERGIVINLTAKTVIRLAPPINIDKQLWDQGLDVLVSLLSEL
jgi:acetylornithine aminotransferase